MRYRISTYDCLLSLLLVEDGLHVLSYPSMSNIMFAHQVPNARQPSIEMQLVPSPDRATSIITEKEGDKESWPTEPQLLGHRRSRLLTAVLLQLALMLLSALFVAFGIVVNVVDQWPVENHPLLAQTLLEASRYVS